MQVIKTDVAIVGAGGTGLRAAIAVAEKDPNLNIALLSKVYPMRSHTVAAEGGSAGVIQDHDSLRITSKIPFPVATGSVTRKLWIILFRTPLKK